MTPVNSEISRQYLIDYLQEDFRKYPEVRLRLTQEHQMDGVTAKTDSREYFFPTEWVQKMQLDRVRAEAERIKEVLPNRA